MCDIAKDIEFRNVKEKFQSKLNDDLKNIRSEKKIVVPADKSRNYYKMEKNNFMSLLNNNITQEYKKTDDKVMNDITKDPVQQW